MRGASLLRPGPGALHGITALYTVGQSACRPWVALSGVPLCDPQPWAPRSEVATSSVPAESWDCTPSPWVWAHSLLTRTLLALSSFSLLAPSL